MSTLQVLVIPGSAQKPCSNIHKQLHDTVDGSESCTTTGECINPRKLPKKMDTTTRKNIYILVYPPPSNRGKQWDTVNYQLLINWLARFLPSTVSLHYHRDANGSSTCMAVVFSSVDALGGKAYIETRRRPETGHENGGVEAEMKN